MNATHEQIRQIKQKIVSESHPHKKVYILNVCFIVLVIFLIGFYLTQDIDNILLCHKESILEMSLRHNFSDIVYIVMATKESLKLLVKHGNGMVYFDGMYKLLDEEDLQVVSIVAPHSLNNKVCSLLTQLYFFLSLLAVDCFLKYFYGVCCLYWCNATLFKRAWLWHI